MSDDPIVVTGLGAVCPLGTGTSAVWRAFLDGESGIRELAPDDDRLAPGVDVAPPPPVRRAGWVRGFRPRDHVLSPQLRRMDWCSRMTVATMRQAFTDAGLLPLDDATSVRTALVVGSCYGNQRETAVYLQRVLRSGPGAGQPLLFPNLVLNAAAGYAAIELDVRGPNLCVSEHEASGEVALATALDLLQSDMCDVVCVAGVDEIGDVLLDALSGVRLLHPDAEPTDAVRGPHPRRLGRMGNVILGEGAAALVLERASGAAERGARAYARVAGARVGAITDADARSPYGFPHDPDVAATELLALARYRGPAIDGVVGGANGLVRRDALDAAVLGQLRDSGRPIGYAPFRRLVGDWGSSGALGAVLASLALDAGVLPSTSPDQDAASSPKRLLIIGAARGGVLVPIVLDRIEDPRKCSSTASRSSDSSVSS